MTQKEMMAQMQAMMTQIQALVQENAALKQAKEARKLPFITVEGQETNGYILLKMPILRERYASDKGKSGTTIATTGFNKAVDVKGMPGVRACIRVYQPD